MIRKNLAVLICLLWVSVNTIAREGELSPGLENPGYLEKPNWFKNSFLDIREDLAEASENNKRLILYFHQDGCPYCEKLIKDNFSSKNISDKTQKYFELVDINIWGDKEVIGFDGKELTEKAFAKKLKVQYTPTLLMMDEQGKVVLRINGYYHPEKFNLALDYVGQKLENSQSYRDYRSMRKAKAVYNFITNQDSVKNKKNLQISSENLKPLLVIFEDKYCKGCNELHNDILSRKGSVELLKQFNVISYDMWSNDQIITPKGKLTTWKEWSQKLDIKYSPSLVLFDATGNEVIRTEGYLKSFHIQSVLDYVLSGAYKVEPELQRFIETRADEMRAKGIEVDIMK